jgi:acyl-CoA synthetase (AMP-forming)/AMP-acid ligase II
VDDTPYDDGYLRTGDMGFFHDGELYVCGRIKDMIILRGQNYYPQDIENVVEKASGLIRHNCVAAFQIHEDSEPALAIVAEAKNPEGASGRAKDCRRGPELSQRGSGGDFLHRAACDPENEFGQDHAPQDQADVAGRSVYRSLDFSREKDAGACAPIPSQFFFRRIESPSTT